MQNKRGLSAIIGTLLIILLVIVAVGIIWVVVRGVLQDSSDDISFSTITTALDVENVVVDDVADTAAVTVKRDSGEGNVKGVKIMVSDGQNSVVEEFIGPTDALDELEEKTFTLDVSTLGVITEVTVAPILEIESGEQVLGSVTDTYTVVDGGTGGAGEGGEGGEGGETCPNDIREGAEVCDGIDLGGNDCASVNPETPDGILGCLPDCSAFDTSLCTGGTCTDLDTQDCTLQEGACAGSFQTCTGGTWPGCVYEDPPLTGYEAEEVSCGDGVDNDCDGLIDLADETCTLLLSNGDISSVWPGSAPRYFDSLNLPQDDAEVKTYIGKYVLFSEHQEFCFVIASAGNNYDAGDPPGIPEYNMSYLGFQYAITAPTVLIDTEIFSIYKTEQACLDARVL